MTRPMLLVAASFTLFHTAMLSGSVALPLYLTRTLDRPDHDVGLLFSVCALVEVPAALSLMLLPARVRKQWVILLGMVLFVAYFLLVAVSSSMPPLIGTQVARGVAIAVVGALGYRAALLLCGVLSAVGCVLLAVVHTARPVPERHVEVGSPG